ncbi:hypothetical protein FHS18_000299 [Paenibacillus phyllosphaerae]|uniref:Sporulation membrane protein YtrI C-terminal domain-containing protein n=1 Tax=Paenibacillus phyllosphaerae TaxID=274593 RepID=A0A7W5AU15_9BACL|nr:hypothetical protein [Paenibacillus phyllosphaerae]MBB3108271.1 hypothetical protein [Paenibacillus phyllosphaerae]
MRVPPFERYSILMKSAASFVVGTIIGAMFYHSIFTSNFEALTNTNIALEEKLGEFEAENKELKQFKNKHSVIKSIQPVLEDNRDSEGQAIVFDELTKTELKKRVRDSLKAMLGRNIYDIDSDAKLVRLLLDQKVYTAVIEKDYTIEIRTVLVVENVLRVWFSAEQYKRPPS